MSHPAQRKKNSFLQFSLQFIFWVGVLAEFDEIIWKAVERTGYRLPLHCPAVFRRANLFSKSSSVVHINAKRAVCAYRLVCLLSCFLLLAHIYPPVLSFIARPCKFGYITTQISWLDGSLSLCRVCSSKQQIYSQTFINIYELYPPTLPTLSDCHEDTDSCCLTTVCWSCLLGRLAGAGGSESSSTSAAVEPRGPWGPANERDS